MLSFCVPDRKKQTQILKKPVDLHRIALTTIDGKRRIITSGVSLSITHSEVSQERQTRGFTLHSKRGIISANLVAFLKSYLFERGWEFIEGGTLSRGVWKGVFLKSEIV